MEPKASRDSLTGHPLTSPQLHRSNVPLWHNQRAPHLLGLETPRSSTLLEGTGVAPGGGAAAAPASLLGKIPCFSGPSGPPCSGPGPGPVRRLAAAARPLLPRAEGGEGAIF